jgi:phosphoglucosamine mutase
MTCDLFGTDGIRTRVGRWPLTSDGLWAIGGGIGSFLKQQQSNPWILLAYDTRESASFLETNLVEGLREEGITVESVGVAPTPCVSFLVPRVGASMGLVLSASHNTFDYNGIKFFNDKGEKLSIHEESLLEASILRYQAKPSSITQLSPLSLSLSHLAPYQSFLSSVGQGLQGLRVVLDCANGALSHMAPVIFQECGATVLATLGCSPNGRNINEDVGSLHPETLCQAVIRYGADMGFGFDGDGDRVILVTSKGQVMDGDQIIACLAEKEGAGGVVGTVMSNLGLELFLAQRSIPFVRAQVGDRLIAEKMRSLEWFLGGEPCGHILIRKALPTGDGLLVALMVARQVALKGIVFPLFQPIPSVLKSIPLSDKALLNRPEVQAYVQEVTSTLSGRLLLRCSGTEPVIRLLVEGEDTQNIEQIANEMTTYLIQAQEVRYGEIERSSSIN